jgi:Radical SAM superfamily/4Fe-4S single cluster domain
VRVIGREFEDVDGFAYQNASVIRYQGGQHVFSHRAIFTIVVMAACNAACKFCSNEITFTPSGRYVAFDAKLARARDFALLAGVKKVAFTGGEPTLNPQGLADLASRVVPGFNRARLHTNGSGLFEPVETAAGRMDLIDALKRTGLTGASISVAHWDPEVNREVMRWKPGWNAVDTDHLRRIAGQGDTSFSPRLSCVMTAESVASPEDMLDYMAWGRSLGFKKFIFRTCSQIPEDFQKPTNFSSYNTQNAQSVDVLSRYFDGDSRFELKYRQRKADSKVDVYRWQDTTFDVDESSEEADPDPKIRRLNFMPDRVLYTSWIDPQACLFADDHEQARHSTLQEIPLLLTRSSEGAGA